MVKSRSACFEVDDTSTQPLKLGNMLLSCFPKILIIDTSELAHVCKQIRGSVYVVAMLYVLLCSTEPRYIESGMLDCVVGCADVLTKKADQR